MNCQKARLLWELLLYIVGVNWVFAYTISHILFISQVDRVSKKRKRVGEVASLYFMDDFEKEEQGNFL